MKIVHSAIVEQQLESFRQQARSTLQHAGYQQVEARDERDLRFERAHRVKKYLLAMQPSERAVYLRLQLHEQGPLRCSWKLSLRVDLIGLFVIPQEEEFWRLEAERLHTLLRGRLLGAEPNAPRQPLMIRQGDELVELEANALMRRARDANYAVLTSSLFFAAIGGIASTTIAALNPWPMLCGFFGFLLGRYLAMAWLRAHGKI